mgnify:FL=1
MDDYPVFDLTDVRGFERLYVTLVRDGMIKPGKYTLLYNWYQANALSSGKQEYFSRKAFCDRLANTDKKPYHTMIQAMKAMDLVMWNINVEVGQADWCVHSYEQMNGIWNEYQCMFRETYGLPPNSKYTSYKLCENSLYPQNEPLSDLDPQSVREKNAPRMVYICAPLRGEEMTANIERARMYARDVLLQGDVPFCPHIYFPQIADASNAIEDGLAMQACLAYLDNCQQINVYADPPTPGMQTEIEHAAMRGIPVKQMPDPILGRMLRPAISDPCR